ncbi:Protein Greb1 [Manis pentadactyla]|nr:Protein Greb1 [Manis pentadactyla]
MISGKSVLNPSLHICKTKMITGKKLEPCPTHSHHYVPEYPSLLETMRCTPIKRKWHEYHSSPNDHKNTG